VISTVKEDDVVDSPYLNSLGVTNQIQNPVEEDYEGYTYSSSSSSSSSSSLISSSSTTSSSDSASASFIIESDVNASQLTPLTRESLMARIQNLVVEEDESFTSGSTSHSGGSTVYSC